MSIFFGHDTSRRWLLLLTLLALAFAACGATSWDPAHPAEEIRACGRQWALSGLPVTTMNAAAARAGVDPTVVDPLSATCPAGACGALASEDPCATVIYARIGEDAYVSYELQGGP